MMFLNVQSSVYWQQKSFVAGGIPATASPLSSQDYSPILKKLSYQVTILCVSIWAKKVLEKFHPKFTN
jgi:hypothetical protein